MWKVFNIDIVLTHQYLMFFMKPLEIKMEFYNTDGFKISFILQLFDFAFSFYIYF